MKEKKGRILTMGDQHGALLAVKQVLERAKYDPSVDLLINLGDISDGWVHTAELVQFYIELNKEAKVKPIYIRGNHDCGLIDWFERGMTHPYWVNQGGQATIDSYVRTGKFGDPEHKEFWNNQKNWYIDEENRLFIHAGWNYLNPLGFEAGANERVEAWGSSLHKQCHWDRNVLEGAASGSIVNKKTGRPTRFKAIEQFKEIYIGHTAIKSPYKPLNFLNLWNLDTGCGWNGKLTIMDIDTKEYWQSDLCSELYPDELGRR